VLVDAARDCYTLPNADARALAAALPVFTREQGAQLVASSLSAPARDRPR